MKTSFAASVLTAFIYAQGLLCFAAVATVIMRDQPVDAAQEANRAELVQADAIAIRL